MLTVKHVSLIAGLVAMSLAGTSTGVVAQGSEEFLGPDPEAPLAGYTRSDGTVVLTDESFCRYVLGSALGQRELTYVDLLDKTRKQKKARSAAFVGGSDEAAVANCVDLLAASRTEAPEDDPLAAWARAAAVVPEAMARLLPEDFVAEPLAQPGAIGDAARTSGFGDLVSAPFSVTPGPWLAELDAAACERWDGTLRDARDPEIAHPIEDNREYLYDLAAGHYYWDVTASDCEWSVDLVPLQLGPEPTPTPEPRAIVPALHGPGWNLYPDAPNEDFLTAALAREAVFAAGLVPGECHLDAGGNTKDRVWKQEPVVGSLVDFGTAVDIWIATDCDIYLGDRIAQ